MASYFIGNFTTETWDYTQQIGAVPTLDQITTDLSNIAITDDWKNDGAGQWSYIGATPRLFYIVCIVSQDSSDTEWSGCVTIMKNGANLAGSSLAQNAINLCNSFVYFGHSNRNGQVILLQTKDIAKNINTMGPFLINTNDVFTAYVGGAQATSDNGKSTNFMAEFQFLNYN